MEVTTNKKLVYSTIIINSILGVADRVLQLCFYCLTDFDGKNDASSSVKDVALTFCILPSAINFVMILIYVLFHHEEMLTPAKKLKLFFMYLFSSEAICPIGVQKSFKTKYSDNTDNAVVTMKVLNALHIMFVSVPDILIIMIYSSSQGKFEGIGIANLVLSVLFIVWSIPYYFICIRYEDDYENEIYEHAKTL